MLFNRLLIELYKLLAGYFFYIR